LTVEPLLDLGNRQPAIAHFVNRLEPDLARNRTTLIFTNSRSLAERLVWALRRRHPAWADQVAVHHSSLAKARRRDVERRLKQGELRAVVSSTSLELGIDIGTVDGVILIHPPGGVIRLLQRVGRAGHGPGRTRRGLVLTATAAELLEAVVTAASGHAAQCESLHVPSHPLDVLCQQLLGMAAHSSWQADEAFALVRQAYPYRDLSRRDFDDCLDYLSGRRTDGQEWLPPRLRWHGDEFTVAGAWNARILRRNIGTIIAEEPRTVRLQELQIADCELRIDFNPQSAIRNPQSLMSLVGQVDEAFADRLMPGDRFLLDGRCLEYRRSEGGDLLVDEVAGRPVTPRWAGEAWPLSRDLARRLYLLRVQAAEALRDGPAVLADLLRRDYCLRGEAITALTAYFQRQECISEIPDTGTCLLEYVPSDGGSYVHTPLNRAGNDALARVVAFRLARRRGWTVTSLVADLGFALFLPGGAELMAEDLRRLLSVQAFDTDLSKAVGESATLRERFRRVALTGLMLLRNPLGGRQKVGGDNWAERRLFDKVRAGNPDFVLYRQALHEVHEECCDAAAARDFLDWFPRLTMRRRILPGVSPFAESWTQAVLGPMEVVETPEEAIRRLHASLVGAR
jgi:ATP-dependent Lhr-like helicase